MGYIILSCHDSLVSFHPDRSYRMDSSQSYQYAAYFTWKYDRSFCSAYHWLFHSTDTYPPNVRYVQYLYNSNLTPVRNSSSHFIPITAMPCRTNHCQYQCNSGSHARCFLWNIILYTIRKGRNYHGTRYIYNNTAISFNDPASYPLSIKKLSSTETKDYFNYQNKT